MNEFIEFMSKYWFQITTGIFAIVEIVLIIIKRKPKSLDSFICAMDEACLMIPLLINKVERPGDGIDKKAEVIKLGVSIVCRLLGRDLDNSEFDIVFKKLSDQIETVLSTPTKKEILNEK